MSDCLTASSTPETRQCSDDHYYQLQSERSRILSEKAALEKVHHTLLEEHCVIQSQLDDAVSERDEALTRTRELQQQANSRRRQGRCHDESQDRQATRRVVRFRSRSMSSHPLIVTPIFQTEERGEPSCDRVRARETDQRYS